MALVAVALALVFATLTCAPAAMLRAALACFAAAIAFLRAFLEVSVFAPAARTRLRNDGAKHDFWPIQHCQVYCGNSPRTHTYE